MSLVVVGQESSNDAALLVKSLLLFRRNPIRLHFLVDPTARHILSTLMRTWNNVVIALTFANNVEPADPEKDVVEYFEEMLRKKKATLRAHFLNLHIKSETVEMLTGRVFPTGSEEHYSCLACRTGELTSGKAVWMHVSQKEKGLFLKLLGIILTFSSSLEPQVEVQVWLQV